MGDINVIYTLPKSSLHLMGYNSVAGIIV